MTAPAAQKAGVELLTGSGQALDKLPALRPMMAAVAASLGKSLHPSAVSRLVLTLASVDAGKAGDVLSAHAESVAGAAIKCERWDSHLLVGVDRSFVFALVDALFGGADGEPPYRPERPLTKLETAIVRWLFGQLGLALRAAFEPVLDVRFAVDKLDSPPAFDCIGRPSSIIAAATFELKTSGGIGRMFVALPQASLAFLKSAPEREAPAPTSSADPAWSRLLRNRVGRAGLQMRATLGTTQMTLGDIAALKPGQIISLDTVAQNRVRLECNGQPLYWCKLGQADGAYTLNIESEIDREQEFMDDILSH